MRKDRVLSEKVSAVRCAIDGINLAKNTKEITSDDLNILRAAYVLELDALEKFTMSYISDMKEMDTKEKIERIFNSILLLGMLADRMTKRSLINASGLEKKIFYSRSRKGIVVKNEDEEVKKTLPYE